MKHYNNKTIAFKQREEHHISKYKFKCNKCGETDFKVIPYPKYKKVLRKGSKFIKCKKKYIISLIIILISIYLLITSLLP